MSELAPDVGGRGKPAREEGRLGGGGLRIYKPGQGYYTRLGTTIGAGILIVAGSIFLFNQLDLDPQSKYALPVKYGVSVGFLIGMSILLYWIVGLHPRANDFFIATEGEMKKVNWASRKEVVRSTKVVIFLTVVLGVILFLADLVFIMFFSSIKVLHAGPGYERLYGSGS